MEIFDWYQNKFLESTANIKSVIKDSVGKELTTEKANGIVVCLQQGRLFFQSANNAPLEIKPLLTFYGMIGFAKGLVLARSAMGIETLKQSHGLSEKSPQNAKLHELSLIINKNGTFPRFNDVISHKGRLKLIGDYSDPYYLGAPFDNSEKLFGKRITLKDILSRLPSLQKEYKSTFREDDNVLQIKFSAHNIPEVSELQVSYYSKPLYDFNSLRQLVNELRSNYPFLEKWCFDTYMYDPSGSSLHFCNLDKNDSDEFSGKFV